MRIVLITGEDVGHRYLANKLAAKIDLAGIVVDQGNPGASRWRRLCKRYTISQLISRVGLKILTIVCRDKVRRRRRAVAILESEDSSSFHSPHLVARVRGVNSKEGVRVVQSLQPDVILVFGTGVVNNTVLSLARQIALNLHTGISPYYRGADCVFWALHNNELNMLGATVHECTTQLDGGRIFATVRASLQADDDMFGAFFRCLVAGTDLYCRVIEDLIAGRLEGTPQDLNLGFEYRAVMHGVRADLKVRRQVKNGLIRRYVLSTDQRLAQITVGVQTGRHQG